MSDTTGHSSVHEGSLTHVLSTTLEQLAAQSSASQSSSPASEQSVTAQQTAATAEQTEGAKTKASQSSDANTSGPQTTLGALMGALDERAFGLLLLFLALPCCIPGLWGIPQIVALPMLVLTAQLAIGREHPWLPKALNNRPLAINGMQKIVSMAERYLGWLERFAAERLIVLTHGVGLRIVAALMLIPTASILVPLPLTNTVPGIGVAIAAVGLLERDGLLVLLGLFIGLLWVFMLVFFGAEAIHFIKDLLLNRGQ